MEGYSPLAFRERIFKEAIREEQGNEEERMSAILDSKNKNKIIEINENGQPTQYLYKQIMEMYYSSLYAIAINKKWNIKHDIIAADSPDIFFINKANENDRIAIEIYQDFNFEDKDTRKTIDTEKQVEKLYKIKGKKAYGMESRLLIINRLNSATDGYNVSEYCKKINQYSWNFSHIILCIFRQKEGDYTFFYVYPNELHNANINFIVDKDSKFWY
jgi:hypothetical protein